MTKKEIDFEKKSKYLHRVWANRGRAIETAKEIAKTIQRNMVVSAVSYGSPPVKREYVIKDLAEILDPYAPNIIFRTNFLFETE